MVTLILSLIPRGRRKSGHGHSNRYGSSCSKDTYLGLGGNDVDLVDSSKRASVDAEGAGNQQKTGSQLVQEDDALSLVDAGQHNQNGSGSDGRTQFAAEIVETLKRWKNNNLRSFHLLMIIYIM